MLGFLAEKPIEYANIMSEILDNIDIYKYIKVNAKQSIERFSDEIFCDKFNNECLNIIL